MGQRRSYRLGLRAEEQTRTRRRILDVARQAVMRGSWDDMTLQELGKEASVTRQTIANHFESKSGLLTAVVHELADEITDLRGDVEPGDVDGAVESLLRQYEVLGDVNVSYVARAAQDPEIASHAARARAEQGAWLTGVFGAALEAAADRDQLFAAVYAATDVGTWKLLRRDLQLSRSQTAAAMKVLTRGVLAEATRTDQRVADPATEQP